MKGYWTRSEYIGRMPDGSWRRFSTEGEYIEAYLEDLEEAD